jgi:hypothetical protein
VPCRSYPRLSAVISTGQCNTSDPMDFKEVVHVEKIKTDI